MSAPLRFPAPLDDLEPGDYEAHIIYSPLDGEYPGDYWATLVRPLGSWGGCLGTRGRTPIEALAKTEDRMIRHALRPTTTARCRRVVYYMDGDDPNHTIMASIAHAEGQR